MFSYIHDKVHCGSLEVLFVFLMMNYKFEFKENLLRINLLVYCIKHEYVNE